MAKTVVAEIGTATRIIRPKPLHAVSNRVSGTRTVGGRRIIIRAIIRTGIVIRTGEHACPFSSGCDDLI